MDEAKRPKTGIFIAGALIGAAVAAAAVYGLGGRGEKVAEPVAAAAQGNGIQTASMGAPAARRCDWQPMLVRKGEGDGRARVEKPVGDSSASQVSGLLVAGKEAAAGGRMRDAEVHFLNACLRAETLKDPLPLADAMYQLGRHYAQAGAQGAGAEAVKARAVSLYAASLQTYRQEKGEDHERTRYAAQGLAALGVTAVAAAPAPAREGVTGSSRAAPGARAPAPQVAVGTEPTPVPGPAGRAPDEAASKREAARVAEAERVRAEAARMAEADRARAEAARVAEADRARAEAARVAQADRARTEAARVAEADRARAEAARVAEANRIRGEAARLAEASRARTEAARLAEADRARAEAARLAEAERARAEAQQLAQARRAQAEAERVAEARRARAEAERIAAAERASAEATRIAREERARAEAALRSAEAAQARARAAQPPVVARAPQPVPPQVAIVRDAEGRPDVGARGSRRDEAQRAPAVTEATGEAHASDARANRDRPARPAASPSFDCALARSPSEKLICADEELARQDRNLGRLHSRAKAAAEDPAAFKRQNDAEWTRRERECADRECLLRWYAERREQLRAGVRDAEAVDEAQ